MCILHIMTKEKVSIKEKLQMWKWRDLTNLGRIQNVKTFVIPIFRYRASLICVQKIL